MMGMPFLFQHRVILTINEPSIEVGSAEPIDIIGDNVSKLYSQSAELVHEDLDKIRTYLIEYANTCGFFQDPGKTPLPPLRDINHEILLINEQKIYPWRPARCPDVFKDQRAQKRSSILIHGGGT
jgi:hypothetical protein